MSTTHSTTTEPNDRQPRRSAARPATKRRGHRRLRGRTAAALAVAGALGGFLTIPSATVLAGGQGELRSAFRNEISQFRADLLDPPPIELPAGHISPFDPVRAEVCDDEFVGTWISLLDIRRSELDRYSWDISLNGTPLEVQQTSTRKRKLTGESAGQSIFAFTRGTPVIGKLPAGEYTLEYVYSVDGVGVATFTRDIESSPDHC